MIKCKIKLTDGSTITANLPENTPKDILKFLNTPSKGGKDTMGDFILIEDNDPEDKEINIINRHEIVRVTISQMPKDYEMKEDEKIHKVSTHIHKETNPNGPKRSQQS